MLSNSIAARPLNEFEIRCSLFNLYMKAKTKAKQVHDFGQLVFLKKILSTCANDPLVTVFKIKLYSIYQITSWWKEPRRKKPLLVSSLSQY